MPVSILPMYLHAAPLQCEREVEITWTMRPHLPSRLLRARVETIVPETSEELDAFELLCVGLRQNSQSSQWTADMLAMLPSWEEDWRWTISQITVGNKLQMQEPEPWPQVFPTALSYPHMSPLGGKVIPRVRAFSGAKPAEDIMIKFGRTGPACLVRGVAFLKTIQRRD